MLYFRYLNELEGEENKNPLKILENNNFPNFYIIEKKLKSKN